MFVTSILCQEEGAQPWEERGGSWSCFLVLRCWEEGEAGRAYAMDCKGFCCAGAKVTREREGELYVMYNRHCHFSLWEEMDINKEDISSVTIPSLSLLTSLWFF